MTERPLSEEEYDQSVGELSEASDWLREKAFDKDPNARAGGSTERLIDRACDELRNHHDAAIGRDEHPDSMELARQVAIEFGIIPEEEHQHVRIAPFEDQCSCGAYICGMLHPEEAIGCLRAEGHAAKGMHHFNHSAPDLGEWEVGRPSVLH